MSWNEEKVNKLKELWGKGNTASQIAEIIGGISRNAVIGKAHRLNLSAKIKTRAATSNQNFENSLEERNIKSKRGRKSKFKSLIIEKDFEPENPKQLEELEMVTVKFAGDSGDGIQITGDQFGNTTAIAGNDFSTFPDFPSEIRAPLGTTYGVSSYQIQFAAKDIFTPGDTPDVLVCFNPAALKVNMSTVNKGGIIVVNEDEFVPKNLKKAGPGDLRSFKEV